MLLVIFLPGPITPYRWAHPRPDGVAAPAGWLAPVDGDEVAGFVEDVFGVLAEQPRPAE